MRSFHVTAKGLGVLDRAEWRVFVKRMVDPSVTENSDQVFGRGWKAVLEGGGSVHLADRLLDMVAMSGCAGSAHDSSRLLDRMSVFVKKADALRVTECND